MLKLRPTVVLLWMAILAALAAHAQTAATGGLRGVMTDDSGAVIPAAKVTLTGGGTTRTAQTQTDGSYTFVGLPPGQYRVRVSFPGFSNFDKTVPVTGGGTATLPIQMNVKAEKQEITVADTSTTSVSVEPDNNATALVLRGDDLAALPDDPDDLADALQALAGPGAGPNGGSIYIDGFSGGQLPPKESIREIRINQNPFSAEYDRLGFGRIEVLTRPGTDHYRGGFSVNDSDGIFNSRNPISTNKPSYSNRNVDANFGGPLGKRASFFFDATRRQIRDNALLHAIFVDPVTFTQIPINNSVVTPNNRTSFSPRLDYAISKNNTLVVRFEGGSNNRSNQGVGGYNLPAPYAQTAYSSHGNNENLMVTETSIINTRLVNDLRFQFTRNYSNTVGNLLPTVNVSGAFVAGGANQGNNFDTRKHFELQDYSSLLRGAHTYRWGIRARRESDASMSPSGFGGSFVFDGAIAPALDDNFTAIPGTSVTLTAINQYIRTIQLQKLNFTPTQIRALGGGASQFNIDTGNPYSSIHQYDIGLFAQDDWRVRPNFTFSYGVRYEWQTNISDNKDWAPRIGFAWAPGNAKAGRQKTVIRGGFGMFYDRVSDTLIERAELLNGVNQLSYTVYNPDTFPIAPSIAGLTPSQNSIYKLDPRLRGSYLLQGAIGVERQLPRNTTMAVTYTVTRALHMSQTVPINTPLPGTYVVGQQNSGVRPFGQAAGNLFEYESGGLMKQHILMYNFNTRFSRKVSLFGNYQFNHSEDLPGSPTNPYNFMQDWGRSNSERRHRFQLVGSVTAPWDLRLSPMLTLTSAAPYDVVLGRDIYGDTLKNSRPVFATASCANPFPTPLGDFCTTPFPGVTTGLVPRNFLDGAGNVSANIRISKTIGLGAKRGGGNSAVAAAGPGGPGGDQSGMGGGDMGGGGGRGGRGGFGGGGPRGGGGGGGGARGGGGGMRMGGGGGRGGRGGGAASDRRYSVTFSANFNNALNHYNPSGYVGNLNSPQFGQATGSSTGYGAGIGGGRGGAGGNRRIDFSMRFSF